MRPLPTAAVVVVVVLLAAAHSDYVPCPAASLAPAPVPDPGVVPDPGIVVVAGIGKRTVDAPQRRVSTPRDPCPSSSTGSR